mgnify:CR=1 FL=1
MSDPLRNARWPVVALALGAMGAAVGAGCGSTPPPAPTPDIEAIVQAALAAARSTPAPEVTETPTGTPVPTSTAAPEVTATPTPDIEAIVRAAVAAALPTATATGTHTPTATSEPAVTSTPRPPSATPTPSPPPTPTVRPTATPTSSLTPTSTSTPAPESIPMPTATPSLADVIAEAQLAVVRITTADGSGSGFIYDKSGWVLTNAHVVGDAAEVTVIIGGRSQFTGRVIGVNEQVDLAAVKIDAPNDLPALTLAGTGSVRIGEDVIAIGFPISPLLGTDPTVTKGVLSAKRSFRRVAYV